MTEDNLRYIPTVHPGRPISWTDAWKSTSQLASHYPFLKPVSAYMRNVYPGWVPPLWDYCARLNRMLTQLGGCDFAFVSIASTAAGLRLGTYGGSDAIDGLTRKFQEKSRHTCARCGAGGKPYRIDHDKRWPLCAACAAPFLLRDDLDRLDAVAVNAAGARPFVVLHTVPKSLKPAFNLWLANRPVVRTESGKTLGCYPWDFVGWVASLAPLKKRVAMLVKERQGTW